jgi:hypothetical protein
MRRGFLNQKLGKRNSRRRAFEREKNDLAKVAGGLKARGSTTQPQAPIGSGKSR